MVLSLRRAGARFRAKRRKQKRDYSKWWTLLMTQQLGGIRVPGFIPFDHYLAFGVPKVVLRLLYLLSQYPPITSTVNAVELFAGRMRLSKALCRKGLFVLPYDCLSVWKRMDLCTDFGFALALWFVMCLQPGGLLWLAPVCTSWTFVNRWTSGRNPILIEGDATLEYVRLANLMVSRCALLIWVAEAKMCSWVVEQPQTVEDNN